MSKIPPVKIQGRLVGHGHRPLVVAEMSGNHNGDIDRALKLMIEAKKAGVDAVKLQTYTPDTITINHDGPEFILDKGLWKGESFTNSMKKRIPHGHGIKNFLRWEKSSI